jgi:type II secretory pathway pseudopilin PulG
MPLAFSIGMLRSSLLRPDSRARRADGVTLVETLIGFAIVSVLAVTMAMLVAMAREATARSRRELMALTLAKARLEQLEGLALSRYALPSGTLVDVTDLVTDLSGPEPALGGAGLAEGPPDALIAPRSGYVDYLDSLGNWIGRDAAALPRAAYVRRWTVRRLGAGPTELVMFEVLVAPVTSVMRSDGAPLLTNAAVVRLQGARARRAQ